MAITFGMLTEIKTQALRAQGADATRVKSAASSAESVFDEYKKYQQQLGEAEENGGQTNATGGVFSTPSISVSELEAKIDKCESDFERYYAIVNGKSDPKPPQGGDNPDDKNNMKLPNLGSLMA